ncbi:hypothetical protein [Streptomyces sp. 3N207]|uniref:hypothetical protein n=1 Tax=Streptomyces sp. 3N207 TaxID=3457417 RepID=UPI003FD58394
MARRRKGGSSADDDNAGWSIEELPDGSLIRTKVHPERVDLLEDHIKSILSEEARDRGMTLFEYVGWVARMPDSELHVYRDRVMSGSGGPRLAVVYDAWLWLRSQLTEIQSLQRGWPHGEPDRWM